MEEKRRFTRVHFHSDTILVFNSEEFKGELLDLSLKGALLEFSSPPPIPKGAPCLLKAALTSQDASLEFNADLVHTEGNRLGFKFTSMDVDTMTHLRRLLELNTGDSEKVTDELSFLMDH